MVEILHIIFLLFTTTHTHRQTYRETDKQTYRKILSSSSTFVFDRRGWLGSLVIRELNLRINGREFDSRPPHYQMVSRTTRTGNRLQVGIPSRYVTSHPGQLSLLPSEGRMTHSIRGWTCGWQVKQCDPSLTVIRAILSALEMSIALITRRYTNVLS